MSDKHRLVYENIHNQMVHHVHGNHLKDLFVCHETASTDIRGWADINGNINYLGQKDYGIHGANDLEGHMAWGYGLGNSIFWQCGGVNERSVGVEQVSPIPLLLEKHAISVQQAYHMWLDRPKQLHATALMIASWHNGVPKERPIRFSDGTRPGVTSHWNVSQHFAASDGHTDCWPHHLGGYYPLLIVIEQAKALAKLGYHF